MQTRHYLGLAFNVEYRDDYTGDTPWENSDGHGPVSDWTREEPGPGDRVLVEDWPSRRLYRFDEALDIAKRDQWGAKGDGALSPDEKARRAVEADYEFLRDFCQGHWSYVGIVVTLAGTKHSRSLWGIESNANASYLAEIEQSLMDDVLRDAPAYLRDERRKLDAIDRAIMAIGIL
jgi:hypothetical protein